ncbi:MAG: ABC transporter substrate-binding protein, partial [Mesorhizobium sp.]
MFKFGLKLAAAAAVFVGVGFGSAAQAAGSQKTFYLLSHGGPSDAFWIDWNAGATRACDQLQVTCKISFSGGDMAAQKEAFNSALAAKPDGIATTSAQPGLWTEEVKAAKAAGIPIETEGIASVFDPLGIKYDVVDCGTDPAGKIPVVGWGNSKETAQAVKEGFVNAAAWQYPSAQGFMPVALLGLAASGEPIGYDVHTFGLYDASSVEPILKLYD